MRGHRRHRWSFIVLAAFVAFAQFVLAAEPCRLAHDAASSAHHEEAMDTAACLVQCLGQDESVSSLASLFSAVLTAAPAAFYLPLRPAALATAGRAEVPHTGPPLQILYCSFLS